MRSAMERASLPRGAQYPGPPLPGGVDMATMVSWRFNQRRKPRGRGPPRRGTGPPRWGAIGAGQARHTGGVDHHLPRGARSEAFAAHAVFVAQRRCE